MKLKSNQNIIKMLLAFFAKRLEHFTGHAL